MKSTTCIVAAVAGVLSAGSVRAADIELQQQVNELKGQVAQLQQNQAAASKEVAATIESVLRDAEKRSQMLAAGDSGAGYDDGFFIKSGAFELRPSVLFQFWNVTDYRENTGGGKDDEIENGFEIHRLELGLAGTAFTESLSYTFLWNTSSDEGGGLSLLDAYVNYMFCDQWGITAGQQAANFAHEDYLGDGMLMAADRSLFDIALGGYVNRIQGAGILYGNYNEKNPLNAVVMLHDGSNSLNSNYVGHYPNNPSTGGSHSYDFGMLARAEYKAMGNWDNYQDLTAKETKDNLFVLGAAINWDQGGNGNVLGLAVDAQFEMGNGLGFYLGGVFRYTDGMVFNQSAMGDWGLVAQVSYLLNPAWEVFGRYSVVQYENAITYISNVEDTFHEFTLGVNYYLGNNGSAGHRAKVTVDLNWLPSGTPGSMPEIGYLGDTFDNEIVIRGQFQLAL